jgi:hypothetical protein
LVTQFLVGQRLSARVSDMDKNNDQSAVMTDKQRLL